MKFHNQDGMSLKPVAVMLVILAGLTYYILNDIKKIQTIPANKSSKASEPTKETPPVEIRTSETDAEIKAISHEEVLIQLEKELKKPDVCQTAFINREGKPAKFLNSEDFPPGEDIVKVMIKNEVVLAIDKEFNGYKVQDIYLSSEMKTPILNLGSSDVKKAELQVVWSPAKGGEPVIAQPIVLDLIVERASQTILGCYLTELKDAAPVLLPPPVVPEVKSPQPTPAPQTIIKESPVGSVCGAVIYQCSGSFVGDTPYIASHPALQTDGTFCEGHVMGQPKCVFVDAFRGFRLEGLTCPDGYRAITHPGQLSDVESGSGATVETKALQMLMVLCVKQ